MQPFTPEWDDTENVRDEDLHAFLDDAASTMEGTRIALGTIAKTAARMSDELVGNPEEFTTASKAQMLSVADARLDHVVRALAEMSADLHDLALVYRCRQRADERVEADEARRVFFDRVAEVQGKAADVVTFGGASVRVHEPEVLDADGEWIANPTLTGEVQS